MGHDPQLREVESARLDSWKEIASFLHRDARTVRRWERERRLPVHRVPGGERSGVFAYVSELERWLHTAGPVAETVVSSIPAVTADGDASDTSAHTASVAQDQSFAPPSHSALSVFHSLNTLESTFVADTTSIPEHTPLATADRNADPAIASGNAALLAATRIRPRQYQAAVLLLLLTAAIGISAAVVHYRDEKPVKTAAHQPNPEARELYLRGRYYWNLRTEDGLNSAVDLFTQSIVNDPKYAAAYAGLADAYLLLRQYGHMPDAEAYPRALAAARQAIALDDSSPEAHRSLAFILRFWNWDMAAAEKEYRRAIELNPNDSQSHHWYATALLSAGRSHEALMQIDMARALEPQSVSVLADRGLILSLIDVRAGLQSLQQLEQAEPAFVSTHRYLSGVYLQLENYGDFLTESRTAAELSHDTASLAILARAEKVLKNRGPKPMLREMAVASAPLADRAEIPAYTAARYFSLAGDSTEAIHYLHLACDRHDAGFLNIENDTAFVPLRSLSEYNNLIGRRSSIPGGNKQPIARLDTPELSE